ncbi:DUF1254 domain-containing protein [Cupriavidus metallidurans]|uniref:DUF1254 domain-containing protein n=1 Tax=Cupriavidus TaxID=106589 RepID=UPI000E87855D|nr:MULTISPECIES: DUF1254 domain-containing protein [unclassified Cupriavidus]GMG94313.1 hypothetical protein Cmtc_55330 [Cupriavidus sp. TKC]HBD37711.1 DUF1254 domain-containing protein [Cupriavidus sp.]
MTLNATTLDQRIGDAFVYTFPLHDVARTRWRFTQQAPTRGKPANRLYHNRHLLDDRARQVTMPNNDTLYSSAWLDLSDAPVTLAMPDMGDRYYSVALLDAFTNNFACLGPRTNGPGAHTFVIAGPAHHASAAKVLPVGATLVRAPCNDVWLLTRTLVDGEHDAPAVHALQDQMLLQASAMEPKRFITTPDESSPAAYLSLVNEALARNGVPADEQFMVDGWADLGIRAGALDTWSTLDPQVRDAWTRLWPALRHRLEHPPKGSIRRSGPKGSWFSGMDHIGNFGNDYVYRAYIALVGLGALERAEAIYATALVDGDGQAFDGGHRYRLRVPANMPVDAFWSLSMYEFEPDGRRFFTANPLRRYAIGDRTPGLIRNADGSLDIAIQHAQPEGGTANWLPAPAGRFSMALRYYHPQADLIEHRFVMADTERVAG